MTGLFDIALCALVLGLATWTVATHNAFAAVTGYLAYGLLLTLVWVRLAAVDVALTEAAIGTGLTGALLIGAVARLRAQRLVPEWRSRSLRLRVLAALGAGSVTAALVACILQLPDPAPTLAPDVMQNIAATGVKNPITAVLLAFRAMDTLLEAIVLLFALIGVWSLSADPDWGHRPGIVHRADPNGILSYIARLLPPIGVLVAIYILWAGADQPGGKFQGATILAAMWLLTIMAALTQPPPIASRWLRVGLVAGPLIFIAIGTLGIVLGVGFLGYPEGAAKPLIIVIEFALMPSLAITLALLLIGAPRSEPR
ncbi:DUF4040 domain-containing protein [Lysobacter sp. LF1]|uniref:DUF4040 domain-containing protein n=1 Tax=Lysobacter stagni TaxID=3045172 RepID=A0ABT6XI64_9GAMM|nr:hydrogenase subunit MbhD domain-containing protein [Lysobacter sp. LF1]MDI9239844.1 DUF4040 domain-containing protein [Lysobacter sp. LF1]